MSQGELRPQQIDTAGLTLCLLVRSEFSRCRGGSALRGGVSSPRRWLSLRRVRRRGCVERPVAELTQLLPRPVVVEVHPDHKQNRINPNTSGYGFLLERSLTYLVEIFLFILFLYFFIIIIFFFVCIFCFRFSVPDLTKGHHFIVLLSSDSLSR